jgi:hypothetical protein
MEERGIYPSSVPPTKIRVVKPKEKSLAEKIWQ